mgnify:FL=1|jgi:hypothetical protein
MIEIISVEDIEETKDNKEEKECGKTKRYYQNGR